MTVLPVEENTRGGTRQCVHISTMSPIDPYSGFVPIHKHNYVHDVRRQSRLCGDDKT